MLNKTSQPFTSEQLLAIGLTNWYCLRHSIESYRVCQHMSLRIAELKIVQHTLLSNSVLPVTEEREERLQVSSGN